MERARFKGLEMVSTAGTEGTFPPAEESPLEMTINNGAYFLADTEPMGVVAEVIRNDMGDALGVMVYDDSTKQIHRFKRSQIVVRDDGNVTVLPSWFRKSREIIRSIGPMEDAIPELKKAKRKGVLLSEEQAVAATSSASPEVQRFIDEAVILRSQLIGKLHGLTNKREATEAHLRDLTSPGLFDRTPEADRKLLIATLKRSHRLNEQTINAMRDFLVSMDTSYLFPKDPRYRSLFRVEEFESIPEAAGAVGEEEVAEFETFEEAEEFETFDEAEEFETFDEAAGFETFEDVPPAGMTVDVAQARRATLPHAGGSRGMDSTPTHGRIRTTSTTCRRPGCPTTTTGSCPIPDTATDADD
jgi:hypothetical protein